MTFYVGVDYYPEHWYSEQWETYADQMKAASFNVVRLAEFAWVLMEPEEGRFDFDWLDSAISILDKRGISVILGTPTAAMPAWIKHKYPETLASSDGVKRDSWGVRKNNCFTSGAYRLLSERITRAMAEHFTGHPAVIGWQTDNEIDWPVCRCNTCVREFHVFLRDKYGSIDGLNRAWGTHFWGHKFSDWDEIQAAVHYKEDNPSLCLDWHRFQTHLQVRFQGDQVKIIRSVCPRHFITHNFMGLVNTSNCYELAKDLDFASLDSYPDFPVSAEPKMPYRTAAHCDLTRGLKGKNFWIMETTAGPTGWSEFGRNPRPGEMRKTFYQHMAHGADSQLFFRWRTCTSGREQYWHGLLGHDGKPGRRYMEAAQIAQEAQILAPLLEGTTLRPQVAIIYDYDSRWATEIQPSVAGNNATEAMQRYYNALLRVGVNVDVIPSNRSFSAYRVVLAPQLHVLSDETAERIESFICDGGVFLADIRTGVKTESNLCHERTLPGLLSRSLGIEIGEYEAIPDEYEITGLEGRFERYKAKGYADWVSPTTARVMVQYLAWHLQKFACVTRNNYGLGFGYYVGTIAQEETFYNALIADILNSAGIQPLSPPPGVEVSLREGDHHSLLFLINHTEETIAVSIAPWLNEVTTRTTTGTEITLERFGIAIIKIPKNVPFHPRQAEPVDRLLKQTASVAA